ncbi:protein of unknown function [Methylorubrum extorquens]|uniref:Uncharacterized protein n=1 Tax=Methylorubrum extorquens TaxID=408 RepID=A0A2N9AHP5_METEX|nr:protein of unknown function [Methylorubrum extorquens]
MSYFTVTPQRTALSHAHETFRLIVPDDCWNLLDAI